MTPKSLFAILIKVLGLYLVLSSISLVPSVISILYAIGSQTSFNISFSFTLFIFALTLTLYILAIKYCLFRTDWIIEKLSLDKHFTEEKFDINIHRSTVLKVVTLVIGGLILVESLPPFCQELYIYFGQDESFGPLGENKTVSRVILNGVKLLIGYFLFTNSSLVVNVIEKQRKSK